MKKQFNFFLSLLMFSVISFSQNSVNMVIFSEDGDTFYAFINGVKQNTKPESNVKVTGITANVSLRIEFENKAYPQLKQNMPLEPGFEHSFRIKKDAKQQMKLRYFGRVPLNEASTGVATVPYHTANETSGENISTDNTSVNTNVNTNTSFTTTTNTTNNGNKDNVSMNINMGGVGISMNVNGNATGMSQNSDMNTSTSTTVTSSSSVNGSPKTYNNSSNNSNANTSSTVKSGCAAAMSQTAFDKMKQAVESKPFSETKMSTAKVATKNVCLSVNQVKEICKLFSMDEDKLEYAKFAKPYCVNKEEYYQVSDIFSFSGTIDDFNKFLEQ